MNDKEKLTEQLIAQMDKVFFYCVKRCNSRIDAEDLSQDILLDIMININKGIKIENFDYYIWQICKNHYSNYVARIVRDRDNIMFVEEIDEPGNELSSLDKLINSERILMINAAIKLLSSDYAEILYSYYIEDRSLSFISEKLNLPLGTVKRRLFDIRNKLKEYLKMERLNGKKAFVPKNFTTSMSGGGRYNPHQFTKSLINKNILFHSYDNPCTLEDYSLELGISIPYIEEIVNELVEVTLLTKEGNKYITNFPIITKEQDMLFAEIVKEKANDYANKLADFAINHFKEFKEIVNNDHFTDNELMWVFMFYINRIAEQYTIDGNGIKMALYRHKDGGGSWNFDMTEVYEKEKTYPISENWFGNSQLGIRGICHPTYWLYSDEEIMNTICYNNCINGTGDIDKLELDYIEFIIKNPNMKYSQIDKTQKYKVDFLIDNNYVYVENDELKFNLVIFSNSQYQELNSLFTYHRDINVVKKERDKIIGELEDKIKDILPQYLINETYYLASGYFYVTIREYVIRAFSKKGLIKPNNTGKRFNFNAYAWTLEK